LPEDHLARLVEAVVEELVVPPEHPPGEGNPPYDPRLCLKVLLYGYATGTRSSRQLSRLCRENLAYLFLTRGDAPSHQTLCTARREQQELFHTVWQGLFTVAAAAGMKRLGHIVLDSTKLRANASPEAVVRREEFAALAAELERILAEAQEVDRQEDQEGYPGETRVGQRVPRTQMRAILRGVRRQRRQEKRERAAAGEPAGPGACGNPAPSGGGAAGAAATGEGVGGAAPTGEGAPAAASASGAATAARVRITRRLRRQIATALTALRQALQEGQAYLCLTDPAARMMPEGREKKRRACHSFEVAVDREDGLLVAGQTSADGNDNDRLGPLVEAAAAHEPEGVQAVDADAGYFSSQGVGEQLRAGRDTCIPDSNTAADLHRGQPIGTTRAKRRGSVTFVFDAAAGVFVCEEGKILRPRQQREHHGQQVTVYRAVDPCTGCPRAGECLRQKNAVYRTLFVGEDEAALTAARERFGEAAHQERYRQRGAVVETVFGVVRGTLGYTRWLLRGEQPVACEGDLLKLAYQLRKLHGRWAAAAARGRA
jgi:hypothetical protein